MYCIVCNDIISLPSHGVEVGFGDFCHLECVECLYDVCIGPDEEDEDEYEDGDREEYAIYGYDYGND